MKDMQKRVLGLGIVVVSLAASSIVFGKTMSAVAVDPPEAEIPYSVNNGGSSAIAVEGGDVYAIQGGIVYRMDRSSLSIKSKQVLESPRVMPLQRVNPVLSE